MKQFSRSLFFPVESVIHVFYGKGKLLNKTPNRRLRGQKKTNNKAISDLFNITDQKFSFRLKDLLMLRQSFPLCRCRQSDVQRQNEEPFLFQLFCVLKINAIENKQNKT